MNFQPHVLVILQHLPVPLDRRVWHECLALTAAGYRVSVVCPMAPGDAPVEEREGVRLYKYPPAPRTWSRRSFVYEFVYCWLHSAVRTLRLYRRDPFDIIQACNPPDTFFALAAPFKLLGVQFVYDQRDLCPEMYVARFGRDRGVALTALRLLERLTYRLADRVVAPNDSYRSVALGRGRKPPEAVTVVRGGPDLDRMPELAPDSSLKEGRAHLCCYVGVMGPQDHVDVALRAAAHYVHVLGRDDCHFAFLGFGDCVTQLKRLVDELGLSDYVTFTGMADWPLVSTYLATAELGIVPDLKSTYSDMSTLTKVLEYMAFGVPVVAFDLRESRVSAGGAALFVRSGDVEGFAEAMARLVDAPALRAKLGKIGRSRIEQQLAWSRQRQSYVAAYRNLQIRHPQDPGPLAKVILVIRVLTTFAAVRGRIRREPLPNLVARLSAPRTRRFSRRRAATLSRAVTRVLRLGPWRPRCLLGALVLYRLLHRQGDQPMLVIGLPAAASSADAHAWVEVAGVDVGPAPGRMDCEEIVRYPSQPAPGVRS